MEVKIETKSMAISGDGSFAFYEGKFLSASNDSMLKLFNPEDEHTDTIDIMPEISAVASHGEKIAFAGQDGGVYTLNGFSGKPFKMTASGKPVHRLQYTPDGKGLAVYSLAYSLGIIELQKLKYREVKPEHDGACLNGDVADKLVVTVGCDGFMNVVEMKGVKPGDPVARHQIASPL